MPHTPEQKRQRRKDFPEINAAYYEKAGRAKQAEWHAAHKEDANKGRRERRNTEVGLTMELSNRYKKYGISVEQYNEMFTAQYGCCAICNKHQSAFKRRLAVDHDHETGIVRGLLCGSCNTSLGGFCEDIDTLESAIKYIKEHKC